MSILSRGRLVCEDHEVKDAIVDISWWIIRWYGYICRTRTVLAMGIHAAILSSVLRSRNHKFWVVTGQFVRFPPDNTSFAEGLAVR